MGKRPNFKDNSYTHSQFVKFCIERSSLYMAPKKITRPISKRLDADGVKHLDYEEIRVFGYALRLYPEALPYLFKLDGCAKRLFLFLLVFHMKPSKDHVKKKGKAADELRFEGGIEFRFNASTVDEFLALCKLFGESYKEDSVKQAMKDLRKANIVLNVRRGLNVVNPMITGGTNERARVTLIKEYGFQLLQNGYDVVDDFYPRYGNTQVKRKSKSEGAIVVAQTDIKTMTKEELVSEEKQNNRMILDSVNIPGITEDDLVALFKRQRAIQDMLGA